MIELPQRPATLLTIKQTMAAFPIFTEAALRAKIARAEDLHLTKAIHRIGKRVYFIKEKLQEWINNGGTL